MKLQRPPLRQGIFPIFAQCFYSNLALHHHTRCVISFLLSLFFSTPLCEIEVPKTVYVAGTLALCNKPQAYSLTFFSPSPPFFFLPVKAQ